MNTPTEFKVTDPWDYQAPLDQAQIVELAPRQFVSVSGKGDPNGADFSAALGALYAFSYAVRMSYRSPAPPLGSHSYTVGVLQGRWDLVDHSKSYSIASKDNLAWTIMIRQPEFLTPLLFPDFVQTARAKALKKNDPSVPWFDHLKRNHSNEGLFAQTLHVGSYDSEPATFSRLESLLETQGYLRSSKLHYEIYLGDPRKVNVDKLKTILRVPVSHR